MCASKILIICRRYSILRAATRILSNSSPIFHIQVMCHELGCLPVSKICGLPAASELLELDGTPKDAEDRMLKQLPALLTQLEWMAVAMKNQRERTGTF